MERVRGVLSAVLLALFVLVKLSSLHTLTHHEADLSPTTDCEWCQLAVSSEQTDLLMAETVSGEAPRIAAARPALQAAKASLFLAPPFYHSLFSRPPPAQV